MTLKENILETYLFEIQRMTETVNDIIGDHTLNNTYKIMILSREIENMNSYVFQVKQILESIKTR
jgi:hypothetical protein